MARFRTCLFPNEKFQTSCFLSHFLSKIPCMILDPKAPHLHILHQAPSCTPKTMAPLSDQSASQLGRVASDHDVLAGDVAGVWRAQEGHDPCTVLRLPYPAQDRTHVRDLGLCCKEGQGRLSGTTCTPQGSVEPGLQLKEWPVHREGWTCDTDRPPFPSCTQITRAPHPTYLCTWCSVMKLFQ